VSLLVEVREGFIFIAVCAPHGSEAETEPLRDESLLDMVGLCSGLCAGDASVLLRALEVMSGMMGYVRSGRNQSPVFRQL
jgi:hypothetical protein